MIVARKAVTRGTRDATRAGFTLMEVMVVAAILVILAGTGTIVMFRYLEDAKEKAAKAGVMNIEKAAETYKLNTGQFPPSLDVLATPAGGKLPYLEVEGLTDPWGNQYGYEPNNVNQSGKPLIYSGGANPGDASTRITNWGK